MKQDVYNYPTNEEIEDMYQIEKEVKTMIMKCKPCYNFQSVEFDFNVVDLDNDLPVLFELYKKVIDGLKEIAPEQPDKAKRPSAPLATDSQKQIMKVHGIEFTENTTRVEAQELIAKSIEDSKK